MKPEIKQRIEQIHRGDVPEELIRINNLIYPLNWERKTIAEVGSIVTGNTPSIANCEYYVGNRLFITPSDFNNGIYITRTERKISESAYAVSRVIPANSIYVVCIGATIGKINVCLFDAVCNQQINAIIPQKGYCILYLYYAIDYYFNRIKSKYIGEQTLPIVSKGQFCKISIIVPSLREQQKIAVILTTQDKVIELKEKRLAEKQRQKKYLMQQLLTGKKRLLGFSGEWKVTRLHNIVKRHTKRNTVGNANVLTISAQYGLIKQAEFFSKTIASNDKSNYFLLRKGDFAYNKSYSNGYPFGTIKRLTRYDVGIVSPLYICFRLKDGSISDEYLEQYFEAGLMNHEIQAFAQEGARNHGLLNIAVDDFFNSRLLLPPLEEQTAIAEVLSTADREIDLLRQDIEQEKQKKKALMQLLLTGIVRVNV